MKHIVYVTSDEYSNYGINAILVGDAPPVEALDLLVVGLSMGNWSTWEEMDNWHPNYLDKTHSYRAPVTLRSSIRKKAMDHLLANGFQQVEATEVWLG